MRTAIIENGKVKNIIVGTIAGGVDVTNLCVGIGDLYDDSVFTEAPPVGPSRDELLAELSQLELKTTRAFIWLVKTLITKKVLNVADIPIQLKTQQTRMEQIELELAQ